MRGLLFLFTPAPRRNKRSKKPPAPQPKTLPAGMSTFCSLFSPVFQRMNDLYWLATGFQSAPLTLSDYDRLEVARVEGVGLALYRPGTLPELAPYVINDWLTLIGFRAPSDQAAAGMAREFDAAYESAFTSDRAADAAFETLVRERARS